MLAGLGLQQVRMLAFFHLGQAIFVIVAIIAFIATFGVELDIAIKHQDLTGRAQDRALVLGGHVDGGALEAGGFHLRGDRASPDERVEFLQVAIAMIIFRAKVEIGRPDGFVRFLGVLGLRRIAAGLFRQVTRAIVRLDHGPGCRIGFLGHVYAIGTHIRYATFFVELLGGLHRPLGVEADLAGGFLLQRGRDEGWGWIALDRLGLNRGDGIAADLDNFQRLVGVALVAQRELFQRFAVETIEARFKVGAVWCAQVSRHIPVLLRPEHLDLVLAVANDAQCHRLDAASRPATRQFAPQDRRQVEADQIVECAARQIGIDQFAINLAGMFHCGRDCILGDRVEDDTLDWRVLLQGAALAQGFHEVPADGFAFAIGVGREDQRVGFFQRRCDLGDTLGRFGICLPHHREIIVRIDRTILGGKVTDMPVGRQDLIVLAEILVDGFRLCGRLDDDKFHALTSLRRREMGSGDRPCQGRVVISRLPDRR